VLCTQGLARLLLATTRQQLPIDCQCTNVYILLTHTSYNISAGMYLYCRYRIATSSRIDFFSHDEAYGGGYVGGDGGAGRERTAWWRVCDGRASWHGAARPPPQTQSEAAYILATATPRTHTHT
jgi:hypothetical protein